jgi:bifunctional ADP-heptose synthase (sugar kinase/adenylyltransferase)
MKKKDPKDLKIVLLGDSGLDIYKHGDTEEMNKEAPIPIFVKRMEYSKPGLASNVMCNLLTLGCKVHPIFGENISRTTRFLHSRTGQHIFRVDEDNISTPLSFKKHKYEILTSDAIIISDRGKGSITYEFIEDVQEKAKSPIFLHTDKKDLARFKNCYTKINQKNGIECISRHDNCIVTRGPKSVLFKDRCFPVTGRNVVDVTGVGDTFISSLTFNFMINEDIYRAIQFAIDACSVTIQHVGVYSPTMTEINRAIQERKKYGDEATVVRPRCKA